MIVRVLIDGHDDALRFVVTGCLSSIMGDDHQVVELEVPDLLIVLIEVLEAL